MKRQRYFQKNHPPFNRSAKRAARFNKCVRGHVYTRYHALDGYWRRVCIRCSVINRRLRKQKARSAPRVVNNALRWIYV